MATIEVTKEKCAKCLYWGEEGCEMWDEISMPVRGERCDNFEDKYFLSTFGNYGNNH